MVTSLYITIVGNVKKKKLSVNRKCGIILAPFIVILAPRDNALQSTQRNQIKPEMQMLESKCDNVADE